MPKQVSQVVSGWAHISLDGSGWQFAIVPFGPRTSWQASRPDLHVPLPQANVSPPPEPELASPVEAEVELPVEGPVHESGKQGLPPAPVLVDVFDVELVGCAPPVPPVVGPLHESGKQGFPPAPEWVAFVVTEPAIAPPPVPPAMLAELHAASEVNPAQKTPRAIQENRKVDIRNAPSSTESGHRASTFEKSTGGSIFFAAQGNPLKSLRIRDS
jgi:hypothetical protein